MKRVRALVIIAVVGTIPTAAIAQQVSINQQYLGICSGTPLASYSSWLAVATGMTCKSDTPAGLNGLYTTAGSTGSLDWTFVDGPVAFNGLYFSGYGTFYLDLMDGDDVLLTRQFTAYGSDIFIGAPGFSGQVGRIRIRRQSGIGAFGLGDGGVIDGGPAQNQGGGSEPPGPNGNGPGGNGPNGSNNPGGGETGDEPGATGTPDDDINALVSEPNATPEPATLLLVATGLGGVGALAGRRRRRAT